MNQKVSKILRKRANALAVNKVSDLDNKLYRYVIKDENKNETFIDRITRRYKKDSPRAIYLKLKKAWKSLSWTERSIVKIKETLPC